MSDIMETAMRGFVLAAAAAIPMGGTANAQVFSCAVLIDGRPRVLHVEVAGETLKTQIL